MKKKVISFFLLCFMSAEYIHAGWKDYIVPSAAALERRRENRAEIMAQRQKEEERVALQRLNGCSRCF